MNEIKISDNNDANNILRELLNNSLKEIMALLNTECGSLFLFDSQNKELVLDSFYNSASVHLYGLRQRIGEGISGQVVNLKTPVLVKDINHDSRFRRNGFRHYRTNSFISIPLFTSNYLIGVMNLADKSNGESFSEKDLDFAALLCRYICLTAESFISNTKLRQEKETLDKQRALLEKYASVGKLAAGVVHEVNNPLDGIIRYTNMLLNQAENDTVTREYLLEVKKGLNRIANITKSLLEFSHQINSQSTQVKKYVDIHSLLEESFVVLREKLSDNICVNKKYKDNLPKILDFGLLHVFINIIKNALDAISDAGTLEISTNINDSTVEISFKDTGVGIPKEIREQIFEPFFTTKGIDKGTGLGLAISNEIINKYGGSIKVQSSSGKGSTFTVLIPKKYLENA